MKRTIGWGIIGAGDVVARKAACALGADGSRLVGVMRRDRERARAFAEQHRVPFHTTDAAALVARADVDAVYIATPPAHHLEYALAVCAARKPCLIEKPAGRSDEECRKVVEAFRDAGVPLYVSYYRRHLPKFLAVKRVLRSGTIGAVVSVEYRLAKTASSDGWRIQAASSGGGHFYDLAGHVLDLFDDWFGPLTLTGSAAANAIPEHDVEDVVALTFTTPGGAVGSAQWNFAAVENSEELVIEGMLGRIVLAPMARAGTVAVELSPEGVLRNADTVVSRALGFMRERLHWPKRQKLRFADEKCTHARMIEQIVADLSVPSAPASPDAALRTSMLMNRALADYYGGRSGAFWQRPERFASLRSRASARTASHRGYSISNADRAFFEENGYLGPLRCDGDWRRLPVPVSKGRNLHLTEPDVFDVCSHPSIVNRVAQLIGCDSVSLFKSRFIVKTSGHNAEVAWHQDVGPTNGGYYPDGRPVPTLTCWLALDKVNDENGAVRVIPGSHKRLVGAFDKRIRAELVEKGEVTDEDLSSAVTLALEPGEFYLFHSWLLHGSLANDSPLRRAGLNMRYVAEGDEFDEDFHYIPLSVARREARMTGT